MRSGVDHTVLPASSQAELLKAGKVGKVGNGCFPLTVNTGRQDVDG